MDPDVARRLAKRLEETGRHYLDAPISGGLQPGPRGALTSWHPEPRGIRQGEARSAGHGRNAELGDEPGHGAAFKMISQLLAEVHIAAACEAIAFAAEQGLDIKRVYEVITASAGNSWMFENRVPHVLDGDHAPQCVDICPGTSVSFRTWRGTPGSRCRSPLRFRCS